jgi:BirA family transcriptional regulator, biotin operon repressor / biotin---[acetyl-CoA-carboxylase] ligase
MTDRPGSLPALLAEPLEAGVASGRMGMLGRSVLYFETISSTNDVALRRAESGVPDGFIVVADEQRAGRGRTGRAWFSPPGAGLYVSVVIRPESGGRAGQGDGAPEWTRWLTLSAGVALVEGIEAATGLPVQLKWPNDVVVHESKRSARKLAGILAEAQFADGRLHAIVLGFGINVGQAAYPSELAERATSLERELGRAVDRGTVLVEVLASLSNAIDMVRAGRWDDMLRRWHALAPSASGALVEWAGPSGFVHGTTAGLDRDGALLIRTATGVTTALAGEVRWL